MAREDELEISKHPLPVIDADFIRRIYHEQAARLFRLCYKLVGDPEEAENIIQDVFESLWLRREVLRIHTSPEAYLTRAVKLRTLRYFRDKAVQQEHNKSFLREDISLPEYAPEHHVQYNELKEKMNGIVDQLPMQCRNVYRMHLEDGLTNKEIAAELGISESAVEQHKSKARTILKKQLLAFR